MLGRLGVRRVLGAEVRTERHADNLHAVLHGPVDGLDDDVGRAHASEDAHGVDVRQRRNSGPDAELHVGSVRVVRPPERGSVVLDAEPRRGARHVAAVAVAVERVVIGNRRVVLRIGRIIVVAHQVGAALHLRRIGTEQRRVGWLRAVGEGVVERRDGAGTAEVRVRVVGPGVEDGELDVLAVKDGRAAPDGRRADERHAHRVDRLVDQDGLDAHHPRQRRQRGELVTRRAHLDAVDGMLKLRHHGTAHGLDRRGDRVLLPAQVVGDGPSLGLGNLLARGPAPDHGHGIAGHLEEHGYGLRREGHVANRLTVRCELETLRRAHLRKGDRASQNARKKERKRRYCAN